MKKEQNPMAIVIDYLAAILQTLCEIRDALKQKTSRDEELIDQADAKRILKLGDTALYRLRISGKIPYRKIGGKIYYPKSFFNNAFNS
ncbi:helix-turn-helix domain-containing protein [Chryseobacterium sp. Leaf394]|uniref:helix-turn-helix domain-containing protein n=1 Tax=Chryseobacterium sp. Leaf394 TaxID=1736361 RepID=UPI0006FB80D3|nr:helix-turn-helix domain-containing protein [Chryseobacterium sp. Leaf394]KQS88820.1 hypothetical protein ASG21_16935 [Chryseobacterium sp. Leaf394]